MQPSFFINRDRTCYETGNSERPRRSRNKEEGTRSDEIRDCVEVSDTPVVRRIFIYGELHVGLERFGFQYQNIGFILFDARHTTAERSFHQYEKSRKRRHVVAPSKSIEQHSTDDSQVHELELVGHIKLRPSSTPRFPWGLPSHVFGG